MRRRRRLAVAALVVAALCVSGGLIAAIHGRYSTYRFCYGSGINPEYVRDLADHGAPVLTVAWGVILGLAVGLMVDLVAVCLMRRLGRGWSTYRDWQTNRPRQRAVQ